ncbi:OmpA family protein [Methylobacter sp.]|uniref:OmpA family protein n=1 Tax=Methylobacter sp. TaxID=2051955 RepID=UPI002487176D|nr:OmpA family protein [Methylobacter sp.]MDI1276006.1 OmpA family protein [Methylobacter sp.]MDI1356747.1 OmpA family protein [Methylobacter sp.]
MRSVITEISSKLFGLSILIFILALLIPLLRGAPSPAEQDDSGGYESANAPKKTNEGLELKHTQSPAVEDGLQPPITQLQGEVTQNQAKGLTESAQNKGLELEPTQSPVDEGSQPAITQPQGEVTPDLAKGLTESTQPAGDSGFPTPAAEEKRSSQHEPVSLLVLGGGFFSSGQVTPRADIQDAIDNIIPLIQTRPLDNVVVEGHADKWVPFGVSSAQVSKLNENISLRRANAIALVLKQKGVASDRIIVHALGDTVPLASNLTYEGRMKNRRVEIKLLPAQ